MNNSAYKSELFKDCISVLWVSVITSVIYASAPIVLNIFSASILGEFAQYVLNADINSVFQSITPLVAIILLNIVAEPFLAFVNYKCIYIGAAKHHSLIISHFLDKDYMKATQIDVGTRSYRWEEDVMFYRSAFMDVLSKPFIIIISLFFMSNIIFQNINYGLFCVIVSIIPFISSVITSSKQVNLHEEQSKYREKKRSMEMNLAQGHSFIKLNCIGKSYLTKLTEAFTDYFQTNYIKSIKLSNKLSYLKELSTYLAQLLVVIYGVYLTVEKKADIGEIAVYLLMLTPIGAIMLQSSQLVVSCKKIIKYSKRLTVFYCDKENSSDNIICEPTESIETKGLTFSYGEKEILNNLSLKIEGKKKFLICGDNGTGKTTLAKIIVSLIQSDAIFINNKAYPQLNTTSLRKKICYSEQFPYFFEGTLFDNLKMVSDDPSPEKISDMMIKFNLEKDLNDKITSGGENLSGGERQKLSIIRCLLKDADIYLFDEPTNNLDVESIEYLIDVIEKLDKIVILISHDKVLSRIVDEKIELSPYSL